MVEVLNLAGGQLEEPVDRGREIPGGAGPIDVNHRWRRFTGTVYAFAQRESQAKGLRDGISYMIC